MSPDIPNVVAEALRTMAKRGHIATVDINVLEAAADLIDDQQKKLANVMRAIGAPLPMGRDYIDSFKVQQFHAAQDALYGDRQ